VFVPVALIVFAIRVGQKSSPASPRSKATAMDELTADPQSQIYLNSASPTITTHQRLLLACSKARNQKRRTLTQIGFLFYPPFVPLLFLNLVLWSLRSQRTLPNSCALPPSPPSNRLVTALTRPVCPMLRHRARNQTCDPGVVLMPNRTALGGPQKTRNFPRFFLR